MSFGHNANKPTRSSGRNGAAAACSSDTTPTLHRDLRGHDGWNVSFPSNPRMSIQRAFAGTSGRQGGFGWSPPGLVREVPLNMTALAQRVHRTNGVHPAELFGALRNGTLGVRRRNVPASSALRGSQSCPPSVMGHPRPGNACPTGRSGPRPAYLNGSKDQGLARLRAQRSMIFVP